MRISSLLPRKPASSAPRRLAVDLILAATLAATLCIATAPAAAQQDQSSLDTSRGDQLVSDYFRAETEKLTERAFAGIDSLEDWKSRRDEYRRQLFEMLGLDPRPPRTPLKPEITGTVRNDEIIVEKLHFQSRPGLYVTGNLYRPIEQSEPLPTILYVCGHGRVKKNGISYGNKASYQYHGAWFARNGYVCLTIDTIQLGEIEGIHHGTYREGMWWWNSRGYSSAGAEAWNCIRALDYLETREEVDADRIGVTGRSGGGIYSWWVSALDERIRAAVPVAGITSLHNHVVDGTVEGHCDCMFMVNTYRWDFPMVAALVAPRPLLISNSDKDRIFPLEGVIDVHAKVRKIYRLYDAEDKLGLQITEGPHKDTQELRVHAFRWFNRFLKDDSSLIEDTAVKLFEPEQLKVFDELPDDEIVTTVHETFVPKASEKISAEQLADFDPTADRWTEQLAAKVFNGIPRGDEVTELNVEASDQRRRDRIAGRQVEFDSQSPYRLKMYVLQAAEATAGGKEGSLARSTTESGEGSLASSTTESGEGSLARSTTESGEGSLARSTTERNLTLQVLDQDAWDRWAPALAVLWPGQIRADANLERWQQLADRVLARPRQPLVLFAPRGVGPTEWSRDERERTHIRRRFMLLGQTAATMQTWDIRRSLQALDSLPEFQSAKRHIRASGDAAVWSLHASVFAPRIGKIHLDNLPTSHRDAPDYLNVSRILTMPQLVALAAHHADSVRLRDKQWAKIPFLKDKPFQVTVAP